MDISNIDQTQFKQQNQKQTTQKLDVSFRDVMSSKLTLNHDSTRVMPADILNQTKLKSKKKKKDLEEVQCEALDFEESTYKTISDLKNTMKKLVAIERQFLGLK